ncbi:MAG TPA: tetratricopeptide repeat protein [Polyangia bacterium]|jgi:Tetratricopeptide repeat.|nr:tetratricopeptide repeat protein [Polyangia bacterium]
MNGNRTGADRAGIARTDSCGYFVVLIAALAAGTSAGMPSAEAQDASNIAVARAEYETGVRHFDLSEFDEALTAFKNAYRAKPDPAFLFNIAQCHRKLGRIDDAITFYQTYLRRAPDARNREEVEQRIAELEEQRGKAAVRTPVVPVSPPADSVQADSQHPDVARQGLDVGATSTETTSDRPVYKRWWFWTAVGAVAAGAAVTIAIIARRDPTNIPASGLGAQGAMP